MRPRCAGDAYFRVGRVSRHGRGTRGSPTVHKIVTTTVQHFPSEQPIDHHRSSGAKRQIIQPGTERNGIHLMPLGQGGNVRFVAGDLRGRSEELGCIVQSLAA